MGQFIDIRLNWDLVIKFESLILVICLLSSQKSDFVVSGFKT
jgi:hypothetical protein